MSDHKFDFNFKIDVPEQIVDAVAEPTKDLLESPAKSIGEGFGYLFKCVFNPFKYLSKKQEIKYVSKLTQYQQELQEKIDKIPDDKLCEPNFQTVGTAIEDSKYCIESDELRAMFVNLISKTANSDTKDIVHPAFSSMIKEMTSLEAEVLTQFKMFSQWPVVEYRIISNDGGYNTLQTNVFLYKPEHTVDNIDQIASALSNLNRLGLIEISYLSHISDEKSYAKYNEILDSFNKLATHKYTLQKGVAKTTPLGQQFIKVCISD